jgi:hypothetical protein
MIDRTHRDHEPEVREADRDEFVDFEMTSHCFQVGHVLLNRDVFRALGSAAIAHVVCDHRRHVGELFEIIEENEVERHDQRHLTVPDSSVTQLRSIEGREETFLERRLIAWQTRRRRSRAIEQDSP